MKLLMIAGAKGGIGKTTAAVRLAQSLQAQGIPTGIVDLSPYPSAHLMQGPRRLQIVQGRSATTPTAVRSVLKPFPADTRVVLLDTGRMDDPALDPWIMESHALLLLTRIDALSVAALPAVWTAIENVKALNSAVRFAGILPMMVRKEQDSLRRTLVQRFPQHFLAEQVAFDAEEPRRCQADCFTEVAPITGDPLVAWAPVATRVRTLLDVVAPPAPAPRSAVAATKGALASLWRLAANALGGPKVTAVKGA